MPVTVTGPDGKTYQFPDGTTKETAVAYFKKQTTQPAGSAFAPAGLPAPEVSHVSTGAPEGAAQRLLGAGGSSLGGTVLSHLKNIVAGPYHAFKDAPQTADEKSMVESHGGMGDGVNPVISGLNHIGLGANRMFIAPTVNAAKESAKQFTAGNIAGKEYDKEGNYQPNALGSILDAIPIAGGLSRSIENDANKEGAIPALAGLGVDVGVPEAAGGLLGKIRAAAPSMAEGAMGIRRGDRGYGKTPGRAILDETSGVRPETIGRQAQARLNQLNPAIENMADQSTTPVSLAPALGEIDDAISTATARNNGSGIQALQPVRDSLTTNAVTGTPLAPIQTARGALNLKRGLRDQFVKNWSPDAASVLTRDTARSASGVLDSSLDSALGSDFADANQRISSLIPVTEAAEKLSRADQLPQRFGDKLRAHTGALTAAMAGAIEGGRAGGGLGAIGGGALGFALPELISSPTSRMVMARGLDSPIPTALLPPLFTGGIVTPKKEKK